MCPKRHGNGPIGTPNPPRHQRGHQEIAAAAPILFRDSHTRIALFGQKLPHPARKIVGALDFSIMRSNRVSCKSKGTLISKLMLFREFKVHGFWSFLALQAKQASICSNGVFHICTAGTLLLKVVYCLGRKDYKGFEKGGR